MNNASGNLPLLLAVDVFKCRARLSEPRPDVTVLQLVSTASSCARAWSVDSLRPSLRWSHGSWCWTHCPRHRMSCPRHFGPRHGRKNRPTLHAPSFSSALFFEQKAGAASHASSLSLQTTTGSCTRDADCCWITVVCRFFFFAVNLDQGDVSMKEENNTMAALQTVTGFILLR